MKEFTPYIKQVITLETIARLKADKRAEIKQTQEKLMHTVNELFAPVENKGGVEGLIHHINTGIAMYDGVRMGIKVIQRVRHYFRKRRK